MFFIYGKVFLYTSIKFYEREIFKRLVLFRMTFVLCRSLVNLSNAKSFHRLARRYIYVLGIESSCDDTSAAVIHDSGNILSENHFSQAQLHIQAGGIIPIIAYNLHRECIKNVVDNAVQQSHLNFIDLDAVAVTVKPGLILSLKAGLEYAKYLCTLHSKPMIPIHHMEAHALTARLVEDVEFPFLVLLASGGHGIIAVAESVDKFYTLGTSLDNSPGQVLDLIARRAKLKNLKELRGLVGGAAIEAAAVGGDSSKFRFNRSVFDSNMMDCNLSFSGFITNCKTFIEKEEKIHNLGPDEVIPNVNNFCAGVLLVMARNFCQRLEVAFNYVSRKGLIKESEKCLVMSGGVASNQFFRKALKILCDQYEYKLVVPPPKLCTDNGIMIAWNGVERLKKGLPVVLPHDLSSVTEVKRCPLGEDLSDDVRIVSREKTFKFMKLNSYSEIANSNESPNNQGQECRGVSS